jgi:acetyl esterase
VGDLTTADTTCRALADGARCRVLSIGYSLAPEHPFPAAVEDAMLVYRHVVETPQEFGADPDRIAVGGDSAGGNLSAAITHLIRDEGLIRPAFQLLIYPATDLDNIGDHPSRRAFGEGYVLTDTIMRWFVGHYLADLEDRSNPRASPLFFADFAGLPPAYIQTAGFDPLQDEGTAYAQKLADAGVAVELAHYPGLIHSYFNLGGAVKAARGAVTDAIAALARGLGTG